VTTDAGPARRRPGRPPAADSADTEDLILRSAREVFGEVGYAKCTFSEVARRAGVTRPAVNHHFPTKRHLYDAVFESTQDTVVRAAAESALAHEDLAGRLTAFLESASQADSADRSFARFITASVLDGFRHEDLRDRAHIQLEDVRAFVRAVLEEAIARGEVRAGLDVPAVTEMLVAVMWGMGLYAGFVGTHEQLESVIEQFSRLLRGLLW
jgi:AcrR family transcriptional regulator